MEDLFVAFARTLSALQSGFIEPESLWIYPLITLLVALEGPVAILVAATAASAGALKPLPVFLAASIGNLSADVLWYTLGYYSKLDWIIKKTRWFGVTTNNFEKIKLQLTGHAARLLFLAKLTNGLIVPALVTAGVVRVPIRRWLPFVAAAETIVTGLLVVLGYHAAANLFKVEQGLRYAGLGFTVALMLVAFFFGRRMLRHKFGEEEAEKEVITE